MSSLTLRTENMGWKHERTTHYDSELVLAGSNMLASPMLAAHDRPVLVYTGLEIKHPRKSIFLYR